MVGYIVASTKTINNVGITYKFYFLDKRVYDVALDFAKGAPRLAWEKAYTNAKDTREVKVFHSLLPLFNDILKKEFEKDFETTVMVERYTKGVKYHVPMGVVFLRGDYHKLKPVLVASRLFSIYEMNKWAAGPILYTWSGIVKPSIIKENLFWDIAMRTNITMVKLAFVHKLSQELEKGRDIDEILKEWLAHRIAAAIGTDRVGIIKDKLLVLDEKTIDVISAISPGAGPVITRLQRVYKNCLENLSHLAILIKAAEGLRAYWDGLSAFLENI